MTDVAATAPRQHRPRVEGGREGEILDATVEVLAELGYDRLTMDAVATAAKASKATLYRRWSTKAELVVDAISRAKGCPIPDNVDTGSLRGDLISMSCGEGGFTEEMPMSVIAGLLTALHRDEDLKKAFQEQFLAPRIAVTSAVYQRAVERGEIARRRGRRAAVHHAARRHHPPGVRARDRADGRHGSARDRSRDSACGAGVAGELTR